MQVIDRCNLTILSSRATEDLAEFLAGERIEIVASLPCYLARTGRPVSEAPASSTRASPRRRNSTHSAMVSPTRSLTLNLVYNPQGPALPPEQQALQADYQRELGAHFGIRFNHLFALANMPIQRFGSTLVSKGEFHSHHAAAQQSYRAENLDTVMCTNLVSVDWAGALFDCDFNQMLGLPMRLHDRPRAQLRRLVAAQRRWQRDIRVADHCYGCTAGQGSSCGGALLAA